ncbi:hypothetical protein KAFR_0B03780 [Kazachstania africana CBS 2517]|uniref:Uncharacterized protein n=1 Tax=Kazachstania africana (strain ATCC 22294 / BCRC 22015 / CBS 2517 / CECT 1963 / NBRC 1671 / NRRL Y-8276) TaxID=1071382 RepID=H2AQM4_KAZAF|nr:hypothetical protein KAFR_0B03780 [Kazachstania africana CBS 2517]CCF56674.1 hypothetical protein KAFR_0B03780 [Kazachstania africana CBS 2517]
MSEDLGGNISQIKKFLLENNPSKFSKKNSDDEVDGIYATFRESFPKLLFPLRQNNSELSDSSRLMIIDSLSIWFLRSHQILQNKKLRSEKYSADIEKLLIDETNNFLFQYIIDFSSGSSVAMLNALKGLLENLLHLLKMMYDEDQYKSFFMQWINQILDLPSNLRVQYNLITALSNDFDLFYILENKTDFIKTSLSMMSSESLSNPVGKCLVALLINIYAKKYENNTTNITEWLNIWCDDTVTYLRNGKFTKPIKLYLLTPLFKYLPKDVFTRFIQKSNFNDDPNLLLSVLKIGQDLAIEEEPFDPKVNLLPSDMVEELLQDDTHKLQMFELLAYSNKKSKTIPTYVLDTIRNNLGIFFVDVEIETRNYFASSFKHFILRLRDSAYAIDRDAKKLEKAGKFPDELLGKLELIEQYKSFLKWLLKFLKSQLIVDIQYQRISLSFSIIQTLIESGLDDSVPESFLHLQYKRPYPFSISILNDATFFRLLLDNLSSTFSDIRKFANQFLLMGIATPSSNGLFSTINREKLAVIAQENLNVYQNSEIGASIELFLFSISDDKASFIEHRLTQLSIRIDKTTENPVQYLNNGISSSLTSLSMLLESYENTTDFLHIISDSLDLITGTWDVVSEIMCHDASDSLLPMRYINSGIPDQLFTSYAFRSIKESSSLLHVLLQKYPLSHDQLTYIGDLLIVQLLNIRHSGAFQAVLPSFRTCCIRCGKETPAQLNIWLNKILDSLEVKTQHMTRRSGGLPFLVTNILCALPDKNKLELQYVMRHLLRLASSSSGLEYHDNKDAPQITAFNCIKAIFIESKLSNACTEYVTEALALSFKYFTSEIWALRNCSLMLFTSLKNRIFGKANKTLSARVFFSKYIGLKETLLRMLQDSVLSVNETSGVESLFLVLSILLSLKPSSGHDDLSPFLYYIKKCLSDKSWKVRDMAARTLASIVYDHHSELMDLTSKCNISDQNGLHGNLLAILYLISDPEHMLTKERVILLEAMTERLPELLYKNRCFTTVKAYLDVFETLLMQDKAKENSSTLRVLLPFLGNYFLYHSETGSINGAKQLCMAKVYKLLLTYESAENKKYLYELGLISHFYEVKTVALKFFTEDIDNDISTNDTLRDKIIAIVDDKTSPPDTKFLSVKALQMTRNDDASLDILYDMILSKSSSDAIKLAAIESFGKSFNLDKMPLLLKFIQPYLRDDASEEFRLAALNCLIGVSEVCKDATVLLFLFKMLSDDDHSLRCSVADFINQELIGEKHSKLSRSPVITSVLFRNYFVDAFKEEDIFDPIFNTLKTFFKDVDIYSETINQDSFLLFEAEKNNQYRNDIEQHEHFVKILTALPMKPFQLESIFELITEQSNALIAYLEDNNYEDEPLGWLSNPDVLARFVLLRILIEKFVPSRLESFGQLLHKHRVHEIVFDFIPIYT